jgi:small GTP-binding protein
MQLEKIPDLEVEALQGIQQKFGSQLKAINISKIKDLAACDVLDVVKKTKIPLYKAMEFRKKARLVRELIFFESIITKLTAQKYTVQQTIESDVETLMKITGESKERCLDFLFQLSIVTIILDTKVCRSLSISALQTEPYLIETPLSPEKTSEIDNIADEVFGELPAKIAIIGASGVGKSTITALSQFERIPEKHIPTITCDVDEIVVGGAQKIYLHDTGGQEQFGFLWGRWIKGSDGIIIVVDSTPANLEESKFFVEMIKKEAPKTAAVIIANKQDLPGALPHEQIEQELGYKTYPMVGIDYANREQILNIFADLIKLSPRLANLIPTQVKEDTVIKEQEREIEITPELLEKIDAAQAEIDNVDQVILGIKENMKAVQENEEEFRKLNTDLIIANVQKRRRQMELRALVMSGGKSKCLAFDVHQDMRNVSYVIRCECGNIYKKLVTVSRGMKTVVLECPTCGTKCEVPKESWYELYLAAFK